MKKSFRLISGFAACLFVFIFMTTSAFGVTQKEALKEIFPDAGSFKAKKCGDMDYFEVSRSGGLTGYCINVTAKGYGGPISALVGIDPEGTIKGIRILAMCETPGAGARINEVTAGEKEPWFLRQFVGKRAGEITLKKDIDAVSGATISSRAVTDAVNGAVTKFLSGIKRLER